MAFQNPDYSNKWFFAFIDKIEFVSNKNCRIYFTIDEMSTWWDYWWYQNCFVEREHVSNDTFGLHTIDEGLNCGDYIVSSSGSMESSVFNYTKMHVCIGVSWLSDNNCRISS